MHRRRGTSGRPLVPAAERAELLAALAFPPDDPLYGYEVSGPSNHVRLGTVEIRGENGVLSVPMWALTRQRSNPFHAYLLERVDGFIDGAVARSMQP